MKPQSAAGTRRAALPIAVLLLGATMAPSAPRFGKPSPAVQATDEEVTPRADCCFTNRAYSGVCVVKPSEGETCASILAYLNNPRSQGKTYCGCTTIRGGWTPIACEAPGPVERVASRR